MINLLTWMNWGKEGKTPYADFMQPSGESGSLPYARLFNEA